MSIPLTERYRDNITELRKVQKEVADLIDATAIPDTITQASGRDGSPTFLIPTDHGKNAWLGQSSMPAISAEEILRNYHHEEGNVALPGVLTGVEPILTAGKLPNYSAVFVIEDRPLYIKLVFQLYDYTRLISAGRLVFLLNDDLSSNMRLFFQAYPGYEPPRHLLKVPQCSPVRTTQLQRRLESAGEQVVTVHARRMNEIVQSIRRRRFNPIPQAPHVALISADVGLPVIDYTQRIARALDRTGWSYQCCVPDRPDRCHVVERLRTIEQSSADVVLVIGTGTETLRSLLPDELPIATWVLVNVGSMTRPTHNHIKHIGPRDMFFVSSKSVLDGLMATGVSTEQLVHCDVAADDTVFHPMTAADDHEPSDSLLVGQVIDPPRIDVAVLMNLPNDDPHACGIHLTSHLTLWKTLYDETAREVDEDCSGRAEDILAKAQKISGITLSEQQVRGHFLSLLRFHIIPAVTGRAAASVLVEAGYRVRVWGSHWSNRVGQRSSLFLPWEFGGAIPTGHALNRLFHAAKIVVLPDHSAFSLQTAMDALCAGVHVIYRPPGYGKDHLCPSPWAQQYPGLASIMPFVHGYRTRVELTDTVQRLRSSVSSGSGKSQGRTKFNFVPPLRAAREVILKEHTLTHRLRMIIDQLRTRQQSCYRVGQRSTLSLPSNQHPGST